MEPAATVVYREYGIWVHQDEATGRWQSIVRPVRFLPGVADEDEGLTLGPFLSPEAACREAEWQIDLLCA